MTNLRKIKLTQSTENKLYQKKGQKKIKHLSQKSYFEFTNPIKDLFRWESNLSLLKSLINYCQKLAEQKNKKINFYTLSSSAFEALPPENIHKGVVAKDRYYEHSADLNRGNSELIKTHLASLRQLTKADYKPKNIIITNGSMDNSRNVILFLTEPSDEICFIEPSRAKNKILALAFGRGVTTAQLKLENNFSLPQTKEEWDEIIPCTASLLWLDVPGNPTGVGWRHKKEMQALADFVAERKIIAYVNEEYRWLYADNQPKSILELAAPGIITGSTWEKMFCLTSLNLGSLETADPNIASALEPLSSLVTPASNFHKIQEHIATVIQKEGWPYLKSMAKEIEENRNIAEKRLSDKIYVRGTAAVFDAWLVPQLKSDASLQVLIHALLPIIEDLQNNKKIKNNNFTMAVPWNEYYMGNGSEGFRLTMNLNSQTFSRALTILQNQVDNYFDDHQPYYGPIEDFIEKVFKGKKVEPRKWPKCINRQHKLKRNIDPANYLFWP